MKRILFALAALLFLAAGCTKEVKVALDKSEITLEKGTVAVLTAKLTPAKASGKTLTWVSSNPEVATVTPNGEEGIVLGVDAGTAEISVSCDDNTDKCVVTVVIPARSITLNKESFILSVGASRKLTATTDPANSTDAIEWSSSDKAVATVADGTVTGVAVGSATITAKAGSAEASCVVSVHDVSADGAVDLGLSVFWASCNVGADMPEENGDLFAWGETEAKDHYYIDNYKWLDGASNTLTKYCKADGKKVLEPEDDAARMARGGNWRTPTVEEWRELKDNCDWTRAELNGIGGYKVSSKSSPDKWIFLPLAGYMLNKDYSNNVVGQYHGLYWSASLPDNSTIQPWSLHFTSYTDLIDLSYSTFDRRSTGASVRPVME